MSTSYESRKLDEIVSRLREASGYITLARRRLMEKMATVRLRFVSSRRTSA